MARAKKQDAKVKKGGFNLASWKDHIDADETSAALIEESKTPTRLVVSTAPHLRLAGGSDHPHPELVGQESLPTLVTFQPKSRLAETAEKFAVTENLFETYLVGKSKHTRDNYAVALKAFANFAQYSDDVNGALIDFISLTAPQAHTMVLQWRKHMLAEEGGKAFKYSTINRRESALRSLVQIANTMGRCSWTIKLDPLPEGEPDANVGIGLDGARKLLAYVVERVRNADPTSDDMHLLTRDLLIVRLYLYQAFRRSEILTVQYPADVDVNSNRPKIRVKRKKRITPEWVYVVPPVAESLKLYLLYRGVESGQLICNSKGTGISPRGVNMLITKLTEDAGVPTNPHALRHTAATILQNAKGDVRMTARMLGHRDDRSAWRYDDERQQRALTGSSEIVKAIGENL